MLLSVRMAFAFGLVFVAQSGAAQFLYSNPASGGIAAYSISGSGALSPIPGQPFASATIRALAADSAGRYLYALSGNRVLAFHIDSATGRLNAVSGPSVTAGASPTALTVDRTGRFAYIANGGGSNISAFAIDQDTGRLTPVPGSPFSTGASPQALVVDVGGNTLYVAAGALYRYTIDLQSGALAQVSTSPLPPQPGNLAVDPSGTFLFVTSSAGVTVIGTPVDFAVGGTARGVTADSTGKYVYVTAGNSASPSSPGKIAGFATNGGILTALPGSPFPAGVQPSAIVNAATFIYALNQGSISGYSVQADGSLAPLAGSPFVTPSGTTSLIAVKPVSLPASWILKSVFPNPGARTTYDFAGQPEHGYVLLFGGSPAHGGLNDTWKWTGTAWEQQSPAHLPTARFSSAMVYDDARGELLFFGGMGPVIGPLLADTWAWNGSDWVPKPAAASPSPRYNFGMAYDAPHRNTVLFGGGNVTNDLSETWLWNGATWSAATPAAHPSARQLPAMAFDEARGNVLLFGGAVLADALSDTWTWSGSQWSQRDPDNSPTGLGEMTYAPAIGRPVLLTGAETWTWNGVNWFRLFTSPSPPARGGVSLAYDEAHHQVVMYGGRNTAGPLIETWVLTLPSVNVVVRPTTQRPLHAPFGAIPVAILSTSAFDAASQVDRASLTFGPSGDEPSLVSCEPGSTAVRNGGSPIDALVCYFRVPLPSNGPLSLKGRTTDNIPFYGRD